MSAFIYNVTTKVANAIHQEWLVWMQDQHIPKMIATGCFTKAVILKLKGIDETEGITYAVQYHTEGEEQYERYLKDFSSGLRAEAIAQ